MSKWGRAVTVLESERPLWEKVAEEGGGWFVGPGNCVIISPTSARAVLSGATTSFEFDRRVMNGVPAEIAALTSLTSLGLACCNLAALPTELWTLTKLQSINLSYNRLASLSENIGLLPHLTCLDLSYNELSILPAELGALINLKLLNLEGNDLTALPGEMCALTRLRLLCLSFNHLRELPACVLAMHGLQQLDLKRNRLETLPSSFVGLTDLRLLKLKHNKIGVLPTEVVAFLSSGRIDVRGCNLHARYTADGRDVLCTQEGDERCCVCCVHKRRPDIKPWACAEEHTDGMCSRCVTAWLNGKIATCPFCRAPLRCAESTE